MSNKSRKAHNKELWNNFQDEYAEEFAYQYRNIIFSSVEKVTDSDGLYPYVTHNGITEKANVFAHFAVNNVIEEYAMYKTKRVNKTVFRRVVLWLTVLAMDNI